MYTPVNNNIVTENGESYIPSSQRPDGTWRKARRVKDGYVPQEEVPLYESKGKQMLNLRNSLGLSNDFDSEPVKPKTVTFPQVILPSGHIPHQTIPGLYILNDDKKEKKPTKKKTKSKVDEVTEKIQKVTLKDAKKEKINSVKKEETAEVTPDKKIKNLKKKIREIEQLEEKIKNGTLAKPEPEQMSKIKRKNDILMQIHQLEKLLQ